MSNMDSSDDEEIPALVPDGFHEGLVLTYAVDRLDCPSWERFISWCSECVLLPGLNTVITFESCFDFRPARLIQGGNGMVSREMINIEVNHFITQRTPWQKLFVSSGIISTAAEPFAWSNVSNGMEYVD